VSEGGARLVATSILIAIGFLSIPSASRAQLANSSWPMSGHDTARTGQSQYSTSSNDGKLLWAFQNPPGYVVNSAPAIGADGTLYFCGGEGIDAVNSDGTLKWTGFAKSCGFSTPAIGADGTIYSTGHLYLYAFTDGGQGIVTQKWSVSDVAPLLTSPVVGPDGTIYFGDSHGNLLAETDNGTSATQILRFATGEAVSSPSIGTDGTIYFQSGQSILYALNPDFTVKWSTTLDLDISSSPNQPAIGPDGTIYAFPDTNTSVDAFTDGGQGTVTQKWSAALGGYASAMAIAVDGTIYIGVSQIPTKHGFDSDLVALNSDGTRKWKLTLAKTAKHAKYRNFVGDPAIGGDGTIYVTDDSTIFAITTAGKQKWKYSLLPHGKYTNFGAPASPVIGVDGTVYIGAVPGNVKATYPLYALGSKKP